jgi:hypothetical protein
VAGGARTGHRDEVEREDLHLHLVEAHHSRVEEPIGVRLGTVHHLARVVVCAAQLFVPRDLDVARKVSDRESGRQSAV